ncbi:MAG: PilX N-terminal domain-containing pilus assembly protein [Betaproteobacteria bacterium]
MTRPIAPTPRTRQLGMSLFPALMFLLVLSVIGVSTLNSTLMQEKMVSNTKDLNIAFQAAEAGLRDAEADVGKNIDTGTVFTPTCVNGLCTPPSTWSTPSSADISKVIDWSDTSKSRAYGGFTSVPSLPTVAAQPRYVIERLSQPPGLPASPGGSIGLGCGSGCVHSGGFAYRLTSLGTGVRPETRVVLQSTFIVTNP